MSKSSQPPSQSQSAQPQSPEKIKARLIHAWQAEIQANMLYGLVAQRLPQREADIIIRMGEAEAGHRHRLEARMVELGLVVPDPSSVKLSRWLRLQAKLAPINRLLAYAEAGEDDAAGGIYEPNTGDEGTDQLMRELAVEERAHSLALNEIMTGTAAAEPEDNGLSPVQNAAKERLDRIIGREKWHQTGGGWISGAIYGANDGLASVFGIVAGVAGATGGSSFVLTAGAAGAIASALSMATGAYLAERSEAEVIAANIEHERGEIAEHPEEEKEELSLFYQLKGIDPATADAMAEQLARQPDAMLKALSAEEFGATGHNTDNAVESAIAAGISTGLGAIIPVIPFFFMEGTVAVLIAAGISLIAHFLVGAAKSLVTLRTWWAAGLEMTLAGVIVGGATFLVGLALPT